MLFKSNGADLSPGQLRRDEKRRSISKNGPHAILCAFPRIGELTRRPGNDHIRPLFRKIGAGISAGGSADHVGVGGVGAPVLSVFRWLRVAAALPMATIPPEWVVALVQ